MGLDFLVLEGVFLAEKLLVGSLGLPPLLCNGVSGVPLCEYAHTAVPRYQTSSQVKPAAVYGDSISFR
jgi:hypothetical protein